jgi:DNA-binding transcriptional LysR family regulator
MATDDNAASLFAFTLDSAGMPILPAWQVQEDLAKETLNPLLPDHRFSHQGIYAVTPIHATYLRKLGHFLIS